MDSIIRVSTALPVCVPGAPEDCLPGVLEAVRQAAALGSDLIVLPALSLGGASCGSLLQHSAVLEAADRALTALAKKTADINAYLVVGLPVRPGSRALSACTILHRGRVLDTIPSLDSQAAALQADFTAGENVGFPSPYTLYRCGALRFSVLPCHPDRLALYAPKAAAGGAQLLVVPCCAPVRAGSVGRWKEQASALSRALGCGIVLANGGAGETSSPAFYRSLGALYECGAELNCAGSADEPLCVTADFDVDIINAFSFAEKEGPTSLGVGALKPNPKNRLFRPVPKEPFLPTDFTESQDYLEELFRFQHEALAARLRATGIQKLVLGVSGGVDSTLAMLVCAKALDSLRLPRHNLISVTMPGFGTTDRTYYNSIALMDQLGVDRREISIKQAVLQHFEDIGHDPGTHDVTYENAQARERTQILMDVANKEGGLVVGTGDLSEAALGWCTFGGDQFAAYNVNATVTKNVARAILRQQAESKDFCVARRALLDVLDTPVSPELLPPSASGEIHQKTEDILGPYELHEFFLYYFVRYAMAPSKIVKYAAAAFAEQYEPEYIRLVMRTFLKRFFGGQFKRSAAPDTAALSDVSLASPYFTIPSDASAKAMIDELEQDSALY